MQDDACHRISTLSDVVLEIFGMKDPGYWKDDLQLKYVNTVIDKNIAMALRMFLFV